MIKRKYFLILDLVCQFLIYLFYYFYHNAIGKEATLIKNDFASVILTPFDNFIIRNFGQHQNKIDFWIFNLLAPIILSLIHLYFVRKDFYIYKIRTYFAIFFTLQIPSFIIFFIILVTFYSSQVDFLRDFASFINNTPGYIKDELIVILLVYTFLTIFDLFRELRIQIPKFWKTIKK